MKLISLIYSYYNQPKMFSHIVDIINSYSDELLNQIEVIFVDDGSTDFPIQKTNIKCDCRYFRIKKDIGFNNGGAKNIGIKYASGEYVFLLDLDHYITEKTFAEIITKYLIVKRKLPRIFEIFGANKARWFQFKRIRNGLEKIEDNPNVKLIRKEWASKYLYDEDFSGHYGYEDNYQRHLISIEYGKPVIPNDIFINVTTDLEDSNTMISITERKRERNRELYQKKVNQELAYNTEFFRTPYEEII